MIDLILKKKFKDCIFFVAPDIKRGLGLEDILSNYHIICTCHDPLISVLRNQGAKIFCLEEKIGHLADSYNNTGKLLNHDLVTKYISERSLTRPNVLFFKPSLLIETICKNRGYRLLGNKVNLNNLFEDKVIFYNLFYERLKKYFIPASVGVLGEMKYQELSRKWGSPMVIQFAKGWAGKNTYFIQGEKEFNKIREKFIKTRVKITKFIQGSTYLNNACVYKDFILISPTAIQISNISALYPRMGVTCGRQWPSNNLSTANTKEIYEITRKVGYLMKEMRFKGYFGLDFIIEKSSQKIYLIENNARLTASAPFYTKLELGINQIPLLAYHLASFLKKDLTSDYKIPSILKGSQIIFRKKGKVPKIKKDISFGIFQQKTQNFISEQIYQPQNLSDNEFIFIKRIAKRRNGQDLETSRIECKSIVLQNDNQLKDWVQRLL